VKRSEEKEMMDYPGQSSDLLADDLRNLRRLNRYLNGSHSVLLALEGAIGGVAREPISILDVGTGSADIPAAIVDWGRRRHLAAKIVGLEAEAITAGIAAEQSKHLPAIRIIRGDAGAPPFLPGSFDFVVASQFLHHFTEGKIIALLKQWAALARRAIVVSDLVRHPVAYQGIRLLTRLTTRNVMTLVDAPLSVRRAFTLSEWRELFRQANVGKVEMFSVFPFRMAAALRLGERR
jgi:SAM-dependent methyltransferase